MKYILITGACGGLANNYINKIKSDNYYIFALDFNSMITTMYNDANIFGIVCDVTNEESVVLAFNAIANITTKIDFIVNFAGIISIGALVEHNYNQFKHVFDVNLHGTFLINKYAFSFVKEAKGMIINISSEYGIFSAVPFNSAYSISKHALENYNDALRRELKCYGIKVIKIRLGAFKTNMSASIIDKFNDLLKNSLYYKRVYNKMKKMMLNELKRAKDPSLAANLLYRVMNKKKPRIAYNLNISKKMLLLSSLPEEIQDTIYSLYFDEKNRR